MFIFHHSVSSFCLRCNTESEWYQIHENIIKKANSRYNLSGSNTGKNHKLLIHFASSHLHILVWDIKQGDLVMLQVGLFSGVWFGFKRM